MESGPLWILLRLGGGPRWHTQELTAIIDDDTNIRSVDTTITRRHRHRPIRRDTLDLRHLNKLTVDLRRTPGVCGVQRVSKI